MKLKEREPGRGAIPHTLRSLAVVALCLSPASAFAQAIDTARPQMEMMKRIDFEINNYATRLKLGSTVVTYCRVQMQLDTRHASDGSIPFGVNYRNIQNSEELKNVIWVREAYEITYLKLCIARAKRDLDTLEKP